jgi:hypothetical protein
VILVATFKYEKFTGDIRICDGGACVHYCNFSKGQFNGEDIKETITAGNVKSMMELRFEV